MENKDIKKLLIKNNNIVINEDTKPNNKNKIEKKKPNNENKNKKSKLLYIK